MALKLTSPVLIGPDAPRVLTTGSLRILLSDPLADLYPAIFTRKSLKMRDS